MKNFFIAIFIISITLLLGVIARILFRAERIKNRKNSYLEAPEPESDISSRAAESLSAAIRFRTVNTGNKKEFDASSFRGLHAYLKTRYPLFHRRAALEVIGGNSLLYRLPGAGDGTPYLFMSHFDVTSAKGLWERDPFSGDIDAGVVWGRGAVHSKSVVICMLEAAERILSDGLTPPRDIFFAFGHDSESGGLEGAGAIAKLLLEKKMRFSLILDGGTPVTKEILPSFQPMALISVSERGRLDLKLRSASTGGHLALPIRHTALSLLSEAICRIDYRERPLIPGEVFFSFVRLIAPYLPLSMRIYAANTSIFSKRLVKKLSKDLYFSPLVRTSQAPVSALSVSGPSTLPEEAEAVFSYYTIHGDNPLEIVSFVRTLSANLGVSVEVVSHENASLISSHQDENFLALRRALLLSYGALPAAPYVLPYTSDARLFESLSNSVFRFSPFELSRDEQMRIHGTNERIRVSSLGRAVNFYRELYMTPLPKTPIDEPIDESAETPSGEASNAPADKVSNAPADEASSAPADEASNTPSDKISNAPADEAINTPADKASKAPAEEATNAPKAEATNAPADEASNATPDEASKAASSRTPKTASAKASKAAPSRTPKAVSAKRPKAASSEPREEPSGDLEK